MEQPILKLDHLYKSLGGLTVLDSLSFQVNRGDFWGVIGANGSGKTVLANILTGVKQPDAGEIVLNGRPCRIASPAAARQLNLYAVNQTVSLVERLSVAENLFFDRKHHGLISWRSWYQKAQSLLDQLAIPVSARAEVASLSLSQKRFVELAKLWVHEPEIAIFDDCFVSLPPQEESRMIELLLQLRKKGMTILYFSHRVERAFQFCDAVTLIRDSRVLRTIPRGEFSQQALLEAVEPEKPPLRYPKLPVRPGPTVLAADSLSTRGGLRGVSFELREGEILGVAGAMESGRHELARAVFGAEPLTGGCITVRGERRKRMDPKSSILCHIGYLPEDTLAQGLVAEFSIEQNISISRLTRGGFFYRRCGSGPVRRLHIDCTSPRQKVRCLSAGNQQKVSVAKWMEAGCSILILEEPFKGIDAASLVDLYNYVCQLAGQGVAILLISSNYEELAGLSDRVLILKDGVVAQCLTGERRSVREMIRNAYD